jgi:uncharacterized protein YifE (UPF0438 family)
MGRLLGKVAAMNEAGLSERELELLNKHLDFYIDLARGKRKPATEAQEHFLKVCQGRAVAETEHEVVYILWKRLDIQKQKLVVSDRPNSHAYDAPPGTRPYPQEMAEKLSQAWISNDPEPWDDPFRYG